MSGLFGGGSQPAGDHAGLYRPANPDCRQHAADPDRVGSRASSRRTSSGTITSRPTEQRRRQGRRQGRAVQRRWRGSVSYTYSAAIIMALCEGPIAGINQVWKNQSVYTLRRPSGCPLFTGTTPQSEWSYSRDGIPLAGARLSGHRLSVRAELQPGRQRDARQPQLRDPGIFLRHRLRAWICDRRGCRSVAWSFPTFSPMRNTASASRGVRSTPRRSSARAAMRRIRPIAERSALRSRPRSPIRSARRASSERWLQLTNTAAVWSGGLLQVHSLRRQCRQRQRHHIQSECDADLQSRRRRLQGREQRGPAAGLALRPV